MLIVLKVVEARDRRSVMVTTPTSVKSFMLKLVELLHKLDTSRLERAEIREDYHGPSSGIRRAQADRTSRPHEQTALDVF